jgi:hypothetical protein
LRFTILKNRQLNRAVYFLGAKNGYGDQNEHQPLTFFSWMFLPYYFVASAGADTFVAGSAIFNTDNYKATIDEMRAELAINNNYSPTLRLVIYF